MVTCAQSVCTGVSFPICYIVWTSSTVTISYSFVLFLPSWFKHLFVHSAQNVPFWEITTLMERSSMPHFKKLRCESLIMYLLCLPIYHYTGYIIIPLSLIWRTVFELLHFNQNMFFSKATAELKSITDSYRSDTFKVL